MFRRQTIQESNFDSVMRAAATGTPAQLTIRLKIALLARDPSGPGQFNWGKGSAFTTEHLSRPGEDPHKGKVADGDGVLWDCLSWYETEFNAFRIKFKRIVELAWNNQLILLPPDGSDPAANIGDDTFRDFVSSRTVPAHVRCGLEVALVSTANKRGFHAWMEAVKLAKKPVAGAFRSYAQRITEEDVEFERSSGSLRQVVAAHEVGHWLGKPVGLTVPERFLGHVDPEYGRTLSKRMAMMGMGSLVTPFEAAPFLLRAVRHTGLLTGWRVMHRIHFDRGIPISALQKRLFP